MTRDSQERLADITEALEKIEDYVGGSLDDPDVADPMVLDAVLFNLMVIGEAAKSVEEDIKANVSGVPWSDYAGLRDVITHQYFRMQKQIIEDTIRADLPTLRAAINDLTADN